MARLAIAVSASAVKVSLVPSISNRRWYCSVSYTHLDVYKRQVRNLSGRLRAPLFIMDQITPEILLQGYAMGGFPMAESRDDATIHWVDPRRRGIFPLERFHISRSLARHIREMDFSIRTDTDFAGVLAGCADRPETWINAEITALYLALHAAGQAHSLEVWAGADLLGGVYGCLLYTPRWV